MTKLLIDRETVEQIVVALSDYHSVPNDDAPESTMERILVIGRVKEAINAGRAALANADQPAGERPQLNLDRQPVPTVFGGPQAREQMLKQQVPSQYGSAELQAMIVAHASKAPQPVPQGDALGFAIMAHLGPSALNGGKMSVLQAFELGWNAALQSAAQPVRVPLTHPTAQMQTAGGSVVIAKDEGCDAAPGTVGWLTAARVWTAMESARITAPKGAQHE